MRRSIIAVFAVVLGAVAMLGGTSVMAVSSGGIGGRPANPDPKNPRTNTIFIYTLDRGASKSDQVIVSNNSDTTQTIELYAVDGVVTNTGSYSCRQDVEPRVGIGAWLTLSTTQVTLTPGKSQRVDFTLTMPKNADVGEHDGCIVFQSKDSGSETSGNVRIRTRQAIRVVATVPGDLKRDISITSFTVSSGKTAKQLNLSLASRGNVSADVNAYVHLKTLWGKEVMSNGGGYPVLADEKFSLTFPVDVHPMFGGWYIASADIAYDKRAGTFGTDDPGYLLHKSAPNRVVFLAPTPVGLLIMIVIALAIAAGVAWLVWRRRQITSAKQQWRPHKVKRGDTLALLAERAEIDWRKLARVNAIRAPYTLEPGTEILIPTRSKSAERKTTKEA